MLIAQEDWWMVVLGPSPFWAALAELEDDITHSAIVACSVSLCFSLQCGGCISSAFFYPIVDHFVLFLLQSSQAAFVSLFNVIFLHCIYQNFRLALCIPGRIIHTSWQMCQSIKQREDTHRTKPPPKLSNSKPSVYILSDPKYESISRVFGIFTLLNE